MIDRGAQTRERILAAAEPLVLRQGYAGTSLEDILGASGLTKGAFFHHFKDKSAFARALIERCACNDTGRFERCAVEAEAASEVMIESRPTPLGGCVLAAYTHEIMQFEPELQAYIGQCFRRWSAVYEKKFEAVLSRYRPAFAVTARDLAEQVIAIFEGALILSRSFNDPALVVRQLRQFRQYFELLFKERVKYAA
jgi:TetR/AcrR family transcriptional regulator, transcriptional repressor for nem operon